MDNCIKTLTKLTSSLIRTLLTGCYGGRFQPDLGIQRKLEKAEI